MIIWNIKESYSRHNKLVQSYPYNSLHFIVQSSYDTKSYVGTYCLKIITFKK
jgi:hypothetical protein